MTQRIVDLDAEVKDCRAKMKATEAEYKQAAKAARETSDPELEELIAFARERGHQWLDFWCPDDEDLGDVKRMLYSTLYMNTPQSRRVGELYSEYVQRRADLNRAKRERDEVKKLIAHRARRAEL